MPDTSEPSRFASDDARPTSRESMRAAVARRLEETPASDNAPPRIPDHQLLHRIGRGAYGDVWLACNALGTLRAVKVVYRDRFREDRPYEREFNGILKYEPISRTHEGLVQVLHVGRNDEAGCFYYVMELADDGQESGGRNQESAKADAPGLTPDSCSLTPAYTPRTLHSELARRPRLPPTEAAQLALRLAGALGHLHAHGLVHRDIKPSNVIFVGGLPKLADIGLVTDVGSSHSFVGTEGFIPPEGPGTPQADLYGLGKVLYELATGRDRMDFPQLPPGVTRLPDGEALLELNEVMTRACSPEPKARYTTATEFQADLNLFLAGRSLRRSRNLERHLARLRKFAMTACVFLALGAGAVWFAGTEARHARERERAANERARAEARSREQEAALRLRAEDAEHQAQQQLHAALLEQARATVRSGELGQRVKALDALRRAAAISNTVELRREVFAALTLADLRFERDLPTGSEFTLTQLNPAFDLIALCRGRGSVEIRSVSDHRLLSSLPASTNLEAHVGTWSQDGRFLAVKRDHDVAGRYATMEVWDVPKARRVLLLRSVSWGAVSFHPHLPEMMARLRGGTVAVWNLDASNEVRRFTLPTTATHLKYSPDGKRFVAVHDRPEAGILSVHEAADGILLSSNSIPRGVWKPDWHPGGRWIAIGGKDSTVNLVDSRTGETRTLGRHKGEAVYMAFSPDGDYLISGGWERELICWDLQAMRRTCTMALGGYHLDFRADGRQCAVVTQPGRKVQLYAFERPIHHREFAEDLGARLSSATFSDDGRWLAASADERVGLWDLSNRAPGVLAPDGAEARLFFNPDGTEIFGTGRDGLRWRVTPGTNSEAPPQLKRLEFPKSTGFVSLCLISNAVALNSAQGTRLLFPTRPVGESSTVAYEPTADWAKSYSGIIGASPDGRWIGIFRAFSPSLYVHRLPELERVAKLTLPSSIATFRFSPRGHELAIGSRTHLELWNTATWQRTRTLTNFTRILYAADADTWWLTTDSLTGGLYDAHTLQPLLLLPTGTLPLALSREGRYLAVSVDARRLQVWDLAQVRTQLHELGLDWVGSQ